MITVNVNESFLLTVGLVDEETSTAVSEEQVYYDIRKQPGDVELATPVSGTLIESEVQPGIYSVTQTIDTAGTYIAYATCSGFITSTESITVNEENIYDLVKSSRHYNLSVEEVLRENTLPTASQSNRNVALNATDYIITKIKGDTDSNWDTTTVSGIVYAHYLSVSSPLPYKMGSEN